MVFCPVKLIGQEIDSILNVIQNIQYNHPDSALEMSLESFNVFQQKGQLDQNIHLHIAQSKILRQIGQNQEALQKLKEAEKLVENKDHLKLEMELDKEFVDYYLYIRDKVSARPYVNSLNLLSKQLEDAAGIAASLKYQGYLLSNSPDSSMQLYNQALEYSKAAKDTLLTGSIYADLGLFHYLKKAEFKKGVHYYEKSITTLEATNNKASLVHPYLRLSSLLRRMEDNEQSIQYNLKAINAAEESHFVHGMIGAYANMGNAYAHLGRKEDGLEYRKRAANKAISYKLYASLPSIYNNIGASFVTSNPDSALYYLEKCGYYSEKVNNLENLGISRLNMAELYKEKGNYVKAEKYYLESLEVLKRGSFSRHLGVLRTATVNFYLQWAKEPIEIRREIDYVKMKNLLDSAAPHLIEQRDFKASEALYKAYIALFDAQENIEGTNQYRAELISLRDSLFTNTNINAANEWAEKLKTAEKEKEIVQLEAENKLAHFRNRMFLFAFLGTVIFFGIIGWLYTKYQKQRNERHRIQEAQKFRSKLSSNLHDDVGSILSNLSLQSQIASLNATKEQKQELDSIALMSQEAMDNLRDTVWAIDARKDKYDNLLDRMIEYGQKSLRYKDISFECIKRQWENNSPISPEKRQNIYLIFKEAITNIIKHSNGDNVKLTVDKNDTEFTMHIHDNGSLNKNSISDGTGLINMKMRAKAIGGNLITRQIDGFQVQLKVEM